jgi:penicillin amidase
MTIKTYRDAWGIPHLRADSASELAFAQGHNVALDRAFQIELERHRCQGSSAAFLGAEAVGWDSFARQARLADTAQRCSRRLAPETRSLVDAFVAGVNAGLREGARRAPEFAATGLAPGVWQAWTPLGIWLSTHALFGCFPSKLWREEVALRLGDDAIDLFAADFGTTAGSNGWLVSGRRTVHGAAILAGDPHRFIEDPGVYQQIRLACPEFDVLGLAIPGVPGIAHFGHAGSVAWAITNAMADYQDLYYEQLRRRGDQVEALGPEGYRPAAFHEESIAVRDAEPVTIQVIETDRGPVVVGGLDAPLAISLRYVPRVYEELGFDALPALLRATSVADVDRALERWVEPVNVVQAADTRGGLLQRVAGKVPRRPRANVRRVAPAWEAQHAWQGVHEPLPRAPVDDVAVMANERGLAAPFGVEFAPAHRKQRIRQLLGERSSWSARDMAALHMDTFLPSARPLLALLSLVEGLSEDAERLRKRLLGWDAHMHSWSTDAAAFATLRAALVRRLSAQPVLDPLNRLLGEPHPYPELFAPWLALLPRVAFALEALLTTPRLEHVDLSQLLRGALEEVAAADPSDLPWGELHRLAPWQALPETSGEAWPGLAGDSDCVLSTGSVPGVTHACARAPAARFVWDLARRDDSLWVVPLGASGIPGHAHHRDQLQAWLRGELLPVITDWDLLKEEEEQEPTRHVPLAQRTVVHERTFSDFGTIRVSPVDPERDSDLIFSWVTEERARFWGMGAHSREYVQEIYEYLDSLRTHHAYLLYRDEWPVALFQTYEPAEDPVGERYDVQAGDLGIHVMMGPAEAGRLPGFTAKLVSAFLGFVLAEPSVRRIVVEPDVRNHKAVARFVGLGFVPGQEIELPEKRARLAFLSRDAAERLV